MALVLRPMGVWTSMPASCSNARVICGVNPTRKSQPMLSHSDNKSSNLARRVSVSSHGDAALRCQAATLTAVRETVEVDRRTMRCLEDTRAALRNIFEADSARGCDEEGLPEPQFLSMAIVSEQRRAVHHGRRGGGDWYPGLATAPKMEKKEEMSIVGKGEMLVSFEVGRNAEMMAGLAVRAWQKLGDADKAEALFMTALELAPENSAIQASYAEFLWQCNV